MFRAEGILPQSPLLHLHAFPPALVYVLLLEEESPHHTGKLNPREAVLAVVTILHLPCMIVAVAAVGSSEDLRRAHCTFC